MLPIKINLLKKFKILIHKVLNLIKDCYTYIFFKEVFIILTGKDLPGCHYLSEHLLLKKYAKGKDRLVEIGVFKGVSSLAIRESMSPDGTLWLIDPFIADSMNKKLRGSYIISRLYVQKSKNGKVVWLKDFSYNIVRNWSKEIDFLFIDGDHREEACLRDWLEWNRFIKSGGVILLHDARANIKRNGKPLGWPGPTAVVNNFIRKETSNWKIIEEKDTTVVVEKL